MRGGHYTYPVTSETSLPGYPASRVEVKRRFSEFDALHKLLAANYRGYIIPPLPDKAYLEAKFNFNGFIQTRQVGTLFPCMYVYNMTLRSNIFTEYTAF